MRDAETGAPICGSCGTRYQVPPLLVGSVETAARAAGWRVYVGTTQGGRHIDTAMCPTCGSPTG